MWASDKKRLCWFGSFLVEIWKQVLKKKNISWWKLDCLWNGTFKDNWCGHFQLASYNSWPFEKCHWWWWTYHSKKKKIVLALGYFSYFLQLHWSITVTSGIRTPTFSLFFVLFFSCDSMSTITTNTDKFIFLSKWDQSNKLFFLSLVALSLCFR